MAYHKRIIQASFFGVSWKCRVICIPISALGTWVSSVQFVLRDTESESVTACAAHLSCGRGQYLSVKGPHWDNGLGNTSHPAIMYRWRQFQQVTQSSTTCPFRHIFTYLCMLGLYTLYSVHNATCPVLSDDYCNVTELIIAQTQTSVRSSALNSSQLLRPSNPALLAPGSDCEHLNILNPVGISSLCPLSMAQCPDPVTTFKMLTPGIPGERDCP